MRTAILAALVLAPASAAATVLEAPPARADLPAWTDRDTAAEIAFATLVFVDWQQTRWALAHGHAEINPVLGSHPSRERLDALVLGAALAHLGIARVLPRPYRQAWQYVTIALELAAVASNAGHVGFRFSF